MMKNCYKCKWRSESFSWWWWWSIRFIIIFDLKFHQVSQNFCTSKLKHFTVNKRSFGEWFKENKVELRSNDDDVVIVYGSWIMDLSWGDFDHDISLDQYVQVDRTNSFDCSCWSNRKLKTFDVYKFPLKTRSNIKATTKRRARRALY